MPDESVADALSADALSAESRAIQALLIEGQNVRRVLEAIVVGRDLCILPPGLRSQALHAVKQHDLASRRYAEAAAARTIAEHQESGVSGQESGTNAAASGRGKKRRSEHASSQPPPR